MSAPHLPKVAGIDPTVPVSAHTAGPLDDVPAAPGPLLQDRLAGWVSDLTTLHELTERLAGTNTLDDALHELLGAGAALVGARRGLIVFEPSDRRGPVSTIGLGLAHAELGHIETVPRSATSYGRILDGLPGAEGPQTSPDLLGDTGLDPRAPRSRRPARIRRQLRPAPDHHRDGPARRGRLALRRARRTPGTPAPPRRPLRPLRGRAPGPAAGLHRARAEVAALTEELRPGRLPRVPGVQLAARHRAAPRGGGDWYDAMALPEGALGLAVGSVGGSGPSALTAMGRLRAGLRAYAVMEGEDPVAVLSDLELLLRLTEPARSATALFAYCEPAARKIVLAGAGHTHRW